MLTQIAGFEGSIKRWPEPNFLEFDPGNELNCNADFGMDISGVLERWSYELFAYMEQLCPGKLLCNGADHISNLTNDVSYTGASNYGPTQQKQ